MSTLWKKKKLLQKYIITYFLVFAVPLVIFSQIIYRQSVKKYSTQYVEIAQTAANGVLVDLARLLDLAASTANTLRENPYFSSSSIQDFAGSFIYIDQMMSRISALNKDFTQIGFYSTESNLIYTSSTYNKDFYFARIFRSDNLHAQTEFSDLSEPLWIPMQDALIHEAPTCISSLIVPVERGINNGKRTTNSVLIAHLNIERIQQLFAPITALPQTHAVVFYKGVPILSDSSAVLEAFSAQSPADLQEKIVTLNDEQYQLQWNDRNAKFSVLTLIPQKNMRVLASDILRVYLFSLLISALIGLFLIFFGVKQSYQPIMRLFQKAARLTEQIPDEFTNMDEVSQTSYVLDNLVEGKAKAEIAHKEMKLKHVLLRLLENSASYSQQASFGQHLRELQIDLHAQRYCCILFTQCENLHDLSQALSQKANPFGINVFCTEDIDENSAVALLCYSETDTPLPENVLEHAGGLFESAGIGNFVCEINSITVSYKQAYHALISAGKSKGIYKYCHLSTIQENDILVQFSKESELFSSAVSHKQQSKMLLSVSRIADLLEMLPTKDSAGMLLHHILFVAVKALAAANIPYASVVELFENIASPDNKSAEKDWLQALAAHLSALLNENSSAAATSYTNPSMKDIQYALLYINANYAKETFSIKQLADEMGMSISNLSHFFKNKTNQNISDYINELRITQAKRLLTETDLKIADIFPLLGFSHASSFTKSFKQTTGQTPSQYKASITIDEPCK